MNPLDIRVLDRVREQIAALGYPPTVALLAEWLGEATSSVHHAIDRLVASGQLKRAKHKRRGLSLGDQPDLRAVPTSALAVELGRRGVTLQALNRNDPMRGPHGAPCAATICDQRVGRGMLFCRQHWYAIPGGVQEEIKRAFGRRDQAAYEMAITRARDLIDRCGDGLRRVG